MIVLGHEIEDKVEEAPIHPAEIKWKFSTPVLRVQKNQHEIEQSEEGVEEDEEEIHENDKVEGLAFKISTPTLTIEITIGTENADKTLIYEAEQAFERILKIGRKYHVF